jgi:hypothetical protein
VKGKRGVGLFVHKKWKDCVETWKAISERLMMVDMKVAGHILRIVVAYFPTLLAPGAEVDDLYMQLDDIAGEAERLGYGCLVLADCNAVLGERQGEEETESHGGHGLPQTRNDRGSKLLAWSLSRRMRIVNTMFCKLPAKLETHVRGRHRRQIDYCLAARRPWMRALDMEVHDGIILTSDHRPLRGRFRITRSGPGEKKRRKKGGSGFYGWQCADEDEYRRWLQAYTDAEGHSSWEQLESNMKWTASWTRKPREQKKDLGEEAAPTVETQMENWQRLRKEARRSRDEKTVTEIGKKIQKAIQREAVEKKREKVRKILAEGRGNANIPKLDVHRCKKLTYLKVDGKLVTDRKKIGDAFAKELAATFKPIAGDGDLDQPKKETVSEVRLSREDVDKAMQKIKKRKATDGTGMAGELYKAGGDWMTTHLVEKFNNVLESGVAPDLWKPVLFSMLHKDGDRGLIKNYRPLALLPLSYKIFATAILETNIGGNL